MTVYIALLRGINVGGRNKIKMADLRQMCTDIGLQNVQTYIQSGNILFASEDDAQTLRARIEAATLEHFSIASAVILRTSEELAQIIENCPFPADVLSEAAIAAAEVETFYVSLLLEPPSAESVRELSSFRGHRDDFRLSGANVYVLVRDGVRNSKLAANLHRLNTVSTVRNWKTINKLHQLAQAMKS